ncbi:MAG: thiamine diphosphokinase [Bacteroidetes bacterium]|nr:thiamine diphosphokinase [Bacteroidota bacterium]
MKKCIVLANGQPPSKKVFDYLNSIGYDKLICADGGANSAFKLEFIPDYIIGDLDSIRPEIYDYYYDKCEIMQIIRQNDTDVEKCLKFAYKNKFKDVILLGATGDRLDHSFCNLGITLKFFDRIRIRVIHQRSILSVHQGATILKTIPGETISIYGLDAKTKFESEGLKYPLKNFALPFGMKESTSNIALTKEVRLKIKGGKAFVIRDFNVMRKNGLL